MPEATAIRRMFEAVAPRYDLLNRLLSLGIDRGWRRRVVSLLELRPDERILDLCCGTGDLALEIAPRAHCVACDFTWSMLSRAREKSEAGSARLSLAAADALALPFGDDLFDGATVAFGIRNLEDIGRGLNEIRRVLKPGGRLAILEFSQPHRRWLKLPYRLYLGFFLPAVGGLLSRRSAYRYLAESIRGFPRPDFLVRILEEAGFTEAGYVRLSGGIVAIHHARKRGASASLQVPRSM
jgi:demethylmenaquinone methyltransferase/2-methoxy-6-polyprenyl-1,4-benzoquinol methylase